MLQRAGTGLRIAASSKRCCTRQVLWVKGYPTATQPTFAFSTSSILRDSRYTASPSTSTGNAIERQLRSRLASMQAELANLRQRFKKQKTSRLLLLLAGAGGAILLYNQRDQLRLVFLGAQRCTRIGWVVLLNIIDYKKLFRKTWDDTPEGKEQRHEDYEATHKRCAVRLRDALKKNGGIYIKLGQHLSSVQLIPPAWSETFIPLQDHCFPTPMPELQQMFLHDVGMPMSAVFSHFDENPLGVASLAQVHKATMRDTGQKVAVKIMHPDLEEFCAIDMKTTTFMLKVVKSVFPSFEFTWLGEEMEENLPLEMDFRHEAANAMRAKSNFSKLKRTSVVIPDVLWAKERVMVMDFIEGARIDNLEYLAKHDIDRNKVARELASIFGRMVHLHGFFHADPHGGNLLIRPRQEMSRSPYNFEIVLLDHGLYFDMDYDLRINYSRLWLSLISPSSEAVEKDRRKYAYLAGNIDDDLYPIFQAAITGRASFSSVKPVSPSGSEAALLGDSRSSNAGSIMDLADQTDEERWRIRKQVVEEGLVESIFDLLRRVPRRILMVLKLNDLTRGLDASLHTTHGGHRVFMIIARYCARAAYEDDRRTPHSFFERIAYTLSFWRWNVGLSVAERWADSKAAFVKWRLWLTGALRGGLAEAWRAEHGLEQPVQA